MIVYRGLDLTASPELLQGFIASCQNSLRTGEPLALPGYTPCTLDPGAEFFGDVRMVIEAQSAVMVGESEALLDCDSALIVRDLKQTPSGWEVTGQQVPPQMMAQMAEQQGQPQAQEQPAEQGPPPGAKGIKAGPPQHGSRAASSQREPTNKDNATSARLRMATGTYVTDPLQDYLVQGNGQRFYVTPGDLYGQDEVVDLDQADAEYQQLTGVSREQERAANAGEARQPVGTHNPGQPRDDKAWHYRARRRDADDPPAVQGAPGDPDWVMEQFFAGDHVAGGDPNRVYERVVYGPYSQELATENAQGSHALFGTDNSTFDVEPDDDLEIGQNLPVKGIKARFYRVRRHEEDDDVIARPGRNYLVEHVHTADDDPNRVVDQYVSTIASHTREAARDIAEGSAQARNARNPGQFTAHVAEEDDDPEIGQNLPAKALDQTQGNDQLTVYVRPMRERKTDADERNLAHLPTEVRTVRTGIGDEDGTSGGPNEHVVIYDDPGEAEQVLAAHARVNRDHPGGHPPVEFVRIKRFARLRQKWLGKSKQEEKEAQRRMDRALAAPALQYVDPRGVARESEEAHDLGDLIDVGDEPAPRLTKAKEKPIEPGTRVRITPTVDVLDELRDIRNEQGRTIAEMAAGWQHEATYQGTEGRLHHLTDRDHPIFGHEDESWQGANLADLEELP